MTITKLKEIYPDLRSVLLTGHGSEKVKEATEALNTAYFEKDQMETFWDFIKRSNKSGTTVVIRPPSATLSAGSHDQQDLYNPGHNRDNVRAQILKKYAGSFRYRRKK